MPVHIPIQNQSVQTKVAIRNIPTIRLNCSPNCKAVYTFTYSEELNNLPDGERKNILKRARVEAVKRMEKDHQEGKHVKPDGR